MEIPIDDLNIILSREQADRDGVVLIGGDIDEKTGIRGKLLVVGRPCATMAEWYRSMGDEASAAQCEAEEAARAAEQAKKGDDTDTGDTDPDFPPPGPDNRRPPKPRPTPNIGPTGARLAAPSRRTSGAGVRLEPPPTDTRWR